MLRRLLKERDETDLQLIKAYHTELRGKVENSKALLEESERLYKKYHEDCFLRKSFIHGVHHSLIVDEAREYFIPTPAFEKDSAKWVRHIHGTLDGGYTLSYEELDKLRAKIRQERANRFSLYSNIISPLTALVSVITGLLGAIAALVALLNALET